MFTVVLSIIINFSSSASESATFLGRSFIQYEIPDFSAQHRISRQISPYQTGRDYITVAFITTSDSGIILLLGNDEDGDYAILEV